MKTDIPTTSINSQPEAPDTQTAASTNRPHPLASIAAWPDETSTYKWREMKNGQVLDEPAKFNDHAMDALRMAVFSLRRRAHLKPFDRRAIGL